MQWFRSHRRFGARTALLALAVQFVLAFGHVHGIEASAVSEPASAAQRDTGHYVASVPAVPDHDKQQPDDHFCAICTTVSFTSAAQVAGSPALPSPLTLGATKLSHASDATRGEWRYLEPRSRSPPQA